MAEWNYSEYIDVACSHYTDHSESYTCTDTYADYANGAYRNHSNGSSATYHSNYANGAYINHSNYVVCSHYTEHNDHVDYALSDKGVAISLVWTSPWGGSSGARTLGVDYITGSVDAIKQLRDNIGGNAGSEATVNLKKKLSYHIDTSADLIDTPDDDFDDGNALTDEFILPTNNNQLKSNLDDLWAVIRGDDDASTPSTNTAFTGNQADKLDWETLASEADDLATYNDPSYINHVDYVNGASGGYAGPPG